MSLWKKKHSGQAPTLLVLIWDLSQFWPCHTNMLGFFKSLLSRNFCSEICWECLKNILLDIDEFQAEEASSLLILKAIFLSKCHTNILSWPIHELHISRGNIFFAVDFLFDQWNQLRLMFFLLPFYTFHLESYLCHTNTGLLCMATGKQSSLTGAMQIHEVHEEEKPSNWPLLQGSRNQGEQEKILCYPFFGWRLGINHCSISLYHYIIKSS